MACFWLPVHRIRAVFARKSVKLKGITVAAGFFLSMVMGYMEVFVFPVNAITANGEMWFFLIPASFFLFYFITHMELKDRKYMENSEN